MDSFAVFLFISLFLLRLSHTVALDPRQSCGLGYTLCSPQGASIRDIPPIGPGLARLYLNLIETVNPQAAPAQVNRSAGLHEPARRTEQTPDTLCCAANTECMLVLSYNIPCCWDRFTTNFFFADGSYGSITTGNYTTPAGDHANLITGDYELANGQSGNIYQGQTIDEPNTTTLMVPTPWTSSGVGSAIPASEVGSYLSLTSSSLTLATLTSSPASYSMVTINPGSSSENTTITGAATGTGSYSFGSGTIASASIVVPSQSQITPPITSEAQRIICSGGFLSRLMAFSATAMYLWMQ